MRRPSLAAFAIIDNLFGQLSFIRMIERGEVTSVVVRAHSATIPVSVLPFAHHSQLSFQRRPGRRFDTTELELPDQPAFDPIARVEAFAAATMAESAA